MLVNFFGQKLILSLVTLFTLVVSQQPISPDLVTAFRSETLNLEFTEFSPAFAAFEDEYLFANENVAPNRLIAGTQVIDFNSTKERQHLLPTIKTAKRPPLKQDVASLLDQFDGVATESSVPQMLATKPHKKMEASKKVALPPKEIQAEELGFGPLVAMVRGPFVSSSQKPTYAPGPAKKDNHINQNNGGGLQPKDDDPNPPVPTPEPTAPEQYKIAGNISLKNGLAFIGSMEVSWVVGDYELQRGSINVPSATYEIEVSKLVGDIIISLYDTRDELIGEGFLDLTQISQNQEDQNHSIDVFPIDWDVAGEVIDAHSLGTNYVKPLSGVEVALYAFNDATQTDKEGEFSFYNWKKTNSRTLAVASKEGYRESVFTLDSKTEAKVILFSESYMDAFFAYLQDLGIYDVKDQGVLYGQIKGVSRLDGYEVRLDKATPIYFMTAGFASIEQKQTASNGLFSFVGLQDGDYELLVEKDGEIIDSRIVVIEQGKVSPVIVDLAKVTKHLEFFDPLMPERKISNVEVSFFDGSQNLALDQENQIKQTLSRGHDVSLMEYSNSNEVSRTLLSRNKGLQKIPLINDQQLLKLAEKQGYKVEDGLVFGFVDSEEAFVADIAEAPARKVIYFSGQGKMVKEGSPEARGFILAGFEEGLSSIVIQGLIDNEVLGTDLVFSDHQSINITHLEILPLN